MRDSLREGGCQAGRPARSSSLDNPELFQEESPKKINRPVASRWTDNLCLREERQEGPLGTGSFETARCQGASEGGGVGLHLGRGRLIPQALPGRSPCDSEGKWRQEVPSSPEALELTQVRVPQTAAGSQALYVLLFHVVRESVACPHLLEARPRGGAVRACVGWWL